MTEGQWREGWSRRGGILGLLTVLLLALAGCSTFGGGTLGDARNATGAPTPFLESLRRTYLEVANKENEDFRWRLADQFASASLEVAAGRTLQPLPVPRGQVPGDLAGDIAGWRERLVTLLDQRNGRGSAPVPSGEAQGFYDCWVAELGAGVSASSAGYCRQRFVTALEQAEAQARPMPGPYFIQFHLGGSRIDRNAKAFIADVVALGQAAGAARATISGHADAIGSAKGNERLSERRARTVADAMIAAGFPADRLEVLAYGDNAPLVPDPRGRAEPLNRVVTIVFHN